MYKYVYKRSPGSGHFCGTAKLIQHFFPLGKRHQRPNVQFRSPSCGPCGNLWLTLPSEGARYCSCSSPKNFPSQHHAQLEPQPQHSYSQVFVSSLLAWAVFPLVTSLLIPFSVIYTDVDSTYSCVRELVIILNRFYFPPLCFSSAISANYCDRKTRRNLDQFSKYNSQMPQECLWHPKNPHPISATLPQTVWQVNYNSYILIYHEYHNMMVTVYSVPSSMRVKSMMIPLESKCTVTALPQWEKPRLRYQVIMLESKLLSQYFEASLVHTALCLIRVAPEYDILRLIRDSAVKQWQLLCNLLNFISLTKAWTSDSRPTWILSWVTSSTNSSSCRVQRNHLISHFSHL